MEIEETKNRNFKGIWIPKDIYLNKDLNWTEKILLLEIDSLDNEDKHCFASNEYFSKFLGVSKQIISSSISKLKKIGFIEEISFDGRVRTLKSNLKAALNKSCIHPSTKLEGTLKENLMHNNIDNNIYNNTNNNSDLQNQQKTETNLNGTKIVSKESDCSFYTTKNSGLENSNIENGNKAVLKENGEEIIKVSKETEKCTETKINDIYEKFLDNFILWFQSFLKTKNNYTMSVKDNIFYRKRMNDYLKQQLKHLPFEELSKLITDNCNYLNNNFNDKYCPNVNNIYDFIDKIYKIKDIRNKSNVGIELNTKISNDIIDF